MISYDVIGEKMAGPGIRYYHLARQLARCFTTTLAIPRLSSMRLGLAHYLDTMVVVPYEIDNWLSIEPWIDQADICIVSADWVSAFPQIAQTNAYLVIDGYTPLPAELLAMAMKLPESEQYEFWRFYHKQRVLQYRVGDFYLCASERQRDWWLGLLEAEGRLNPETYRSDSSLRNLIDVVPYGLSELRPQHTRAVIKDVWPGIHAADKLILWGGGLWSWLDPLTAVRAVAALGQKRQDIKLVFPGTKHPNPALAATPTQESAVRQLATELGVLDRSVFLGEWISYEAWDNVLLESDVALSLHYDTLETRLAFRSRALEYIRANLPIVATEGDTISQLISHYGIGQCVRYQDVAQVADAILSLLELPKAALEDNFVRAQNDLSWEKVVHPLLRFCKNPYRAADRQSAIAKYEQPTYVELQNQVQQLQRLITGYERGLFIRMMRYFHQMRQNLWKRS